LTLTGLLMSVVVWTAGAWSLVQATATAVAGVPSSWRERLATEYEEALAFRVRDAFASKRALRALSFWLPLFTFLVLFDVMLAVQLLAAAAYAAWATVSDSRSRRARVAQLHAEGLDPMPPNRRLGRWYDASNFALCLGHLTAASFMAHLLVELAGG
jgi:hypothetical protein